MLIFKICHKAEWKHAESDGIYAGSAKDREDHFMHFSTAEQVRDTLERYYAEDNDLVLVAVKSQSLGGALVFEPSRGGALFPHLYQPLPLTFVFWVKPIRRAADGTFVLPKDIP
jgi:uncharacterized protein (DUF952 family)